LAGSLYLYSTKKWSCDKANVGEGKVGNKRVVDVVVRDDESVKVITESMNYVFA